MATDFLTASTLAAKGLNGTIALRLLVPRTRDWGGKSWRPQPTTGARPKVTVLCFPNEVCSAQGPSLTITADAQSVFVT